MIALINLTEDHVMLRDEAVDLGLHYKECSRVGIQDNELRAMDSGCHYRDELTKVDNKYYHGDTEIQYSWYIFDRPTTILDWVRVPKDKHLVELEDFVDKCRYSFVIEKAHATNTASVKSIQAILHTVDEKMRMVNKTIDIMQQQSFNQRVNVHVGGGLITTYNDLCLKEDCCTDELQSELNNGWRIIAVCVQPDQRRPDYVLGRYNPELDVYDKPRAKR